MTKVVAIHSNASAMTSIFREMPSNFYYLIFYCEEDSAADPVPSPSNRAKTYAETIDLDLPRTLSELIKTIVASTNCEYTLRLHAHGCEDICSGITLPHFHLLFYIKTFVGAESYFKKALAMTLEKKNGLKDCNVRLYSVTYPELCLKMEMKNSSSSLRIYGDRLGMISTSQVTFDLGCQYKVIWEFQQESYSPFKGMDDTDRVAHLCNKLLQLQKSDAVFKDSVVDYIDILMRGFGTIEASHHSNTLKVDLGCSNAQCYCFECVEEQNINISRVNRDDFEYHSNSFTFFDENTQFP